MGKLNYTDHPEKEMITIEGINYSYALFKEFGMWLPEGQLFKLIKRKDGRLEIERVEEKK